MFKITNKKGFNIKFENGFAVSVQFGPGNYCENYDKEIGREEEISGMKGSNNAECAVFNPDGKMLEYGDWAGDIVGGYMKPSEVLKLLNWAANQEKPQVLTAICRISNKMCEHYGGNGKCELPATGECHEKQQ